MFKVADAHCDYLNKVMQFGYDLDAPKPNQHTALSSMRQGGVALQFFAAWLNTKLELPPLNQCITMLYEYERMLETHVDTMGKLERGFDFSSGRIATLFTVEDLGAIPNCVELLPALRRFGVTAVSLTWNNNNVLAGSSMDDGNLGLTEYGRRAVEVLDRLNMAIDVSHLSDKGIDDLLSCSENPVFASHSNARAVMDMPRTLSDGHIRAIAQRGGVIGVNFCTEHLTPKPRADMRDVVRHILHIYKVGGPGCCAIGSDFDGIDFCPEGLENHGGMQELAEELLKAGLSEEDVEGIMFRNLYNYIRRFI